MSTLLIALAFALRLYLFLLIARMVVDWIRVFARDWRPRGVVLVIVEAVYSVTDPPLRALRRVIPPLRLGAVALDLGFLVLFLGLSLAIDLLLRGAYQLSS